MQDGTNILYIAKVQGTAYQMGHALGELYGREIGKNLQNLYDSLFLMYDENLAPLIPIKSLQRPIYEKIVLPIFIELLDINWSIAKKYVPKRFEDEMRGVADGSGGHVDYLTLRRVNMVPELTRAACTIVGAWDTATADGKIYHLRTLDWSPTAAVNQYPVIIIYNPTETGS